MCNHVCTGLVFNFDNIKSSVYMLHSIWPTSAIWYAPVGATFTAEPTPLLNKKHTTYICLSKSSSGHVVDSTFDRISFLNQLASRRKLQLYPSMIYKLCTNAVVAVRDCTSLGSSGSMHTLIFVMHANCWALKRSTKDSSPQLLQVLYSIFICPQKSKCLVAFYSFTSGSVAVSKPSNVFISARLIIQSL